MSKCFNSLPLARAILTHNTPKITATSPLESSAKRVELPLLNPDISSPGVLRDEGGDGRDDDDDAMGPFKEIIKQIEATLEVPPPDTDCNCDQEHQAILDVGWPSCLLTMASIWYL